MFAIICRKSGKAIDKAKEGSEKAQRPGNCCWRRDVMAFGNEARILWRFEAETKTSRSRRRW